MRKMRGERVGYRLEKTPLPIMNLSVDHFVVFTYAESLE
jgi:hypothetical protein